MPASPPAARRRSLEEALGSARETRALVVARGAVTQVPEVFRTQFPGQMAVVVADRATYALIGDKVAAMFAAAGLQGAPPCVLDDPKLYAEFGFVEQLEASLRRHGAIPIAVGAGTINDLVKLAAHRAGRQYLCVATAASMDGYTAFGASITFRGAKQTFDCPAPRAVVADLDLMARAPAEMTAAGYADLQAKITAGADWILADALEIEPIDGRAWDIVQGGLREALSDPAGARAGHVEAVSPLVEGLMLGGFAMQWMKSSRPASGAEHQFSHLWDMEHHTLRGESPSHGFKVGIATLAVTAFYEELLRRTPEQIDSARGVAEWPESDEEERRVRARFAGADFVETAVTETRAKHIGREALRRQLEDLAARWPGLRERLLDQLVPYGELKRRLLAVGAPTEPEEIGISRAHLRESFGRAYHIRRRFTVLDVARRTGLLEECLGALFGPGGHWAI